MWFPSRLFDFLFFPCRLMFVLHRAYSGSKAAPFVSRMKLWLGFNCSSIYGYWLRVLYVAKHWICHDFHLPFNEVSNIWELSSLVVSFLQLTGTVSPFVSEFVGKFLYDTQHVGGHFLIPKILHIFHGVTAGSEEKTVVLQDLYVLCFNWKPWEGFVHVSRGNLLSFPELLL